METVTIYTDGSSRGNPGPGGYAAICIYPDAKGQYLVDELGGREAQTTNNRMELQGLIVALENIQDFYAKGAQITFSFFIDSSYVLKGAKEWLSGWKSKNWITSTKEEVKNSDLWKKLDALLEIHKANGIKFKWNLVKGHSEIAGNERCDVIATEFADNAKPKLYKGPLSGYFEPRILETNLASGDSKGKTKKKSSKSTKPTYSYVSLVNGQISTDKTWVECEKRVKGKSGAKFKKSFSASDEQDVISEFLRKS